MTRERALSTRGLAAVAGAGLVAALAAGRPEMAVLASGPLLLVAIGLLRAAEPVVVAQVALARDRLLEGDSVRVRVMLANRGGAAVELELEVLHSEQLALEPGGAMLLRLARGQELVIELQAEPRRWGAHAVGPLSVRTRGPLGILSWRGRLGELEWLRAFPREQRLRELVAPLRTQPFLGVHVSRARGEGIEFADIRPWASGDRARQLNWKVSARRGSLYVNERHPERSSDVVLLLDTFAEARDRAGGTLDAAVRATASLARAYLAHRDRVGLVDFGGSLQWLEPSFGTTQLYRIIDALLASQIAFSYAWRAVDSIPRRVLPPGALVLAITPLLDERSTALVTGLRNRGVDLTVIEVSPLAYVPPGRSRSEVLAHRLWRLQREALRIRLQGSGIPVAVWEAGRELAPALEGVSSFRRWTQRAARA